MRKFDNFHEWFMIVRTRLTLMGVDAEQKFVIHGKIDNAIMSRYAQNSGVVSDKIKLVLEFGVSHEHSKEGFLSSRVSVMSGDSVLSCYHAKDLNESNAMAVMFHGIHNSIMIRNLNAQMHHKNELIEILHQINQ